MHFAYYFGNDGMQHWQSASIGQRQQGEAVRINIMRYLAMVSVSGRGQGTGLEQPLPTTTITTTLYDLIATIHGVVPPEEDTLVVATAVHVLHTGRARFLGQAQEHRRPRTV
jgi:hypothetical protein